MSNPPEYIGRPRPPRPGRPDRTEWEPLAATLTNGKALIVIFETPLQQARYRTRHGARMRRILGAGYSLRMVSVDTTDRPRRYAVAAWIEAHSPRPEEDR